MYDNNLCISPQPNGKAPNVIFSSCLAPQATSAQLPHFLPVAAPAMQGAGCQITAAHNASGRQVMFSEEDYANWMQAGSHASEGTPALSQSFSYLYRNVHATSPESSVVTLNTCLAGYRISQHASCLDTDTYISTGKQCSCECGLTKAITEAF